MGARGSACEAASCTSRSGTPASSAAVMNVPERVRASGLADPGPARDTAHDPPGTVPVPPPPVTGEEDGSVAVFPGGQVDGAGGAGRQRDGDDLAALAGDRQGPVPAFQPQRFNIGAGGLQDPQPAQREQGDQGGLPSGGGRRPAPPRRTPSSLRSRPVAWDS